MAREQAPADDFYDAKIAEMMRVFPREALTDRLRRRSARGGRSPFGWRSARGVWPASSYLPREAGCYAIYVGGCLVYVGSAQSIYHRFQAYHIRMKYGPGFFTPWGQTREKVELKYKPSRRYGDWAMVELRLIRRLKPPCNQRSLTGKPRPNQPWSTKKLGAA